MEIKNYRPVRTDRLFFMLIVARGNAAVMEEDEVLVEDFEEDEEASRIRPAHVGGGHEAFGRGQLLSYHRLFRP